MKEGIYAIDKPPGQTSFSLVRALRKKTNIRKVGHAGTLDPFASGVMILLVGSEFTKKADTFISQDKEYEATLHLGIETTTFDPEGDITKQSDHIPTENDVQEALHHFQGTVQQIPPMYSAKKVQGKKLYELARKGIEIERQPITVQMETTLLDYSYPNLTLKITCSKGTYIRTLGYDLGRKLGCGAHLSQLVRTRCGPYKLQDCLDGSKL